MDKKTLAKRQWISEAAYYKSLEKTEKINSEYNDWIESEQEYQRLSNKYIKSGLVRIV